MGYHIVYHSNKIKLKRSMLRCSLMVTAFFVCFLWCVSQFWPEGKLVMQSLLIPGDPQMTQKAVEVFLQELRSGFALTDAAQNLYDSIMEYGCSA